MTLYEKSKRNIVDRRREWRKAQEQGEVGLVTNPFLCENPSTVPGPSHVFHRMRQTSGRPGQFGNVMVTYLPPFLQTVAEMVADMS